MDTDIYICSKPLQYFNVRNIGYGNASSKKVLIILGHFRDANCSFIKLRHLMIHGMIYYISKICFIWIYICFFTQ